MVADTKWHCGDLHVDVHQAPTVASVRPSMFRPWRCGGLDRKQHTNEAMPIVARMQVGVKTSLASGTKKALKQAMKLLKRRPFESYQGGLC